MAVIQRHIPCHRVFLQVPILTRQTGREIGPRHHGLHAIKRQSGRGVDLQNPRMGVRRADNSRKQHPGQGHVCAVARAACHLVQPVRAVWARADQAVFGFELVFGHHTASRISDAASITARTILS